MTEPDYPPIALGRLDDKSRWVWLSPRPVGVVDWCFMVVLCVLAVPVFIVFGPITLALRALFIKRKTTFDDS